MPQGHDGMMAVTSPVSALMELQDTMTAQRSKIGNFYAVYIFIVMIIFFILSTCELTVSSKIWAGSDYGEFDNHIYATLFFAFSGSLSHCKIYNILFY